MCTVSALDSVNFLSHNLHGNGSLSSVVVILSCVKHICVLTFEARGPDRVKTFCLVFVHILKLSENCCVHIKCTLISSLKLSAF